MFCHKCGNKNLEGATFCQKCGTPMANGNSTQQGVPSTSDIELKQMSQQVSTSNTATPEKTGLFSSIRSIAGGILGFIAIAGALIGYLGIIGLIIVVILGILVFVGWRMTVAEKKQ